MVRWFASEKEEVRVAKGGAPASAGGGAPQARKARQTSFVKPPSREKMEIMSRQMMQEQELEWQQAARLEEMLMLHQRQVHARRLAALTKMAFMGLKQFTTSAKMERVRVAEKAHAKEQAAAESARLARQAAEVARESREQAYLQRRTVQVELSHSLRGAWVVRNALPPPMLCDMHAKMASEFYWPASRDDAELQAFNARKAVHFLIKCGLPAREFPKLLQKYLPWSSGEPKQIQK